MPRSNGVSYFSTLLWLSRLAGIAKAPTPTEQILQSQLSEPFCLQVAQSVFLCKRTPSTMSLPVRQSAPRMHRVLTWRRTVSSEWHKAFGLTLRVTKNNVFIVLYSTKGHVLFWISRGREGFNFHLHTVINKHLVSAMFAQVLIAVDVAKMGRHIFSITARGKVHVKKLIRLLHARQFIIQTFKAIRYLPHNGCRLPKRRRGARN